MDDPCLNPIDLLFFFHKAMKIDLDYLVSGSVKLTEDFRFLEEFQQRFDMVKFLFELHSDAEDEIVLPALEAKGKLQNITHSFSLDHELEVKHFEEVSFILNEMSELKILDSKYEQLCLNLQEVCKFMHKLLFDHIQHEETELWGLFRNYFSIEEQEKIMGSMLGRISGEILKDMIPWLMDSLTSDEQLTAMSLWRQVTRKTMFGEWLREWYNGHVTQEEAEEVDKDPFGDSDPLDIVWNYLNDGGISIGCNLVVLSKTDNNVEIGNTEEKHKENSQSKKICREADKKEDKEQTDKNSQTRNPVQTSSMSRKASQFDQSRKYEHLLTMSQEELVALIRRVSCDASLDPQKKSYIRQNLLMR